MQKAKRQYQYNSNRRNTWMQFDKHPMCATAEATTTDDGTLSWALRRRRRPSKLHRWLPTRSVGRRRGNRSAAATTKAVYFSGSGGISRLWQEPELATISSRSTSPIQEHYR